MKLSYFKKCGALKKLLVCLAVMIGMSCFIPSSVDAKVRVVGESTQQSSKVKLHKSMGNGAGIAQWAEYKVDDEKVFIKYKDRWVEASYSNRSDYVYMVRLGNDVWYFNID